VVLGIAMNFSSIEPIRALYWSAVSNGVVAVPVMAMMMLISTNKRIMGRIPRLLIGKRPPPQGRHFVVGRIFKPMQHP
jgi:Mn2+/Fe2+ NRAMP family transporter